MIEMISSLTRYPELAMRHHIPFPSSRSLFPLKSRPLSQRSSPGHLSYLYTRLLPHQIYHLSDPYRFCRFEARLGQLRTCYQYQGTHCYFFFDYALILLGYFDIPLRIPESYSYQICQYASRFYYRLIIK
jgi:hypothetical protein